MNTKNKLSSKASKSYADQVKMIKKATKAFRIKRKSNRASVELFV